MSSKLVIDIKEICNYFINKLELYADAWEIILVVRETYSRNPRKLDFVKIEQWTEQLLKNATYPFTMFSKSFPRNYREGAFDYIRKTGNIDARVLQKPFDKHGITYSNEDFGNISNFFQYIFDKELVSEEELNKYNHLLIDEYLSFKNKTASNFLDLWMRSKLLKQRNYNKNECKQYMNESTNSFKELIAELERI